MKIVKRVVIGLALAMIVFTIGGFFVLPPLMKSLLTTKLSETLHRNVSIGKISFNPYTFALTVEGFVIQEKGSTVPFVSFEELHADIDVLPLLGKVVFFQELRLRKPYAKIDRIDDSTFNFSDLLDQKATPDKEPPKELKDALGGFKFALNGIRITDCSIDFWDKPKQTKHAVTELNLTVPFISNLQRHIDTSVTPSLALKINGTPYKIEGKTKPFADSLETTFDIGIQNLNIPYYLAYAPIKPQFRLPSAYLDVAAKVSFTHHKQKLPHVAVVGDITLREVVLNDENNNPVLSLPLLNLSIASLEPLARKLHITKLLLDSPQIDLKRGETGALTILSLVPAETKAPSAAPQPQPAEAKKPDEPFQMRVEFAEITKGKVTFQDQSVPGNPVIKIENMVLKGEDISLAKGSRGKFELSCLLNGKGTVNVNGTFGIDPPGADANLSLKNIEIHPFQPYFTDKVKISVTGGAVTTEGTVSFALSDEKGPSARFNGTLSVDRFASVDKLNSEDFLKWNSLYFTNMKFGYNPTEVSIDGVSLTDFFARVTINPDGTLNIREAFAAEGAKPTPPSTAAPLKEATGKTEVAPAKKDESISIKIATVSLQGGRIDFKDQWIKPYYSARLEEINGRISGLSSQANSTADMELRGKFDRYAPLEITGKINPLREDLFVDLKVRFKDMDLSPVTPYAGRYIGYTIERGKLSFDLQYLIDKRKLDSQNNIFIDQLTLGDRVESSDATKLPVRLGIALLKDRSGQIKLDIPVAGTLDDPKFSIWGIVIKVIVNLLTKAATAPFALLGALFGGGEQLSYVEFDYGSDAVNQASAKTIDGLVKALQDRPALRLDIEGFVDVEKDRDGLKRILFERKVKSEKLKDLIKAGPISQAVDEIKVEPQEYEKYLQLAYKVEIFPKPRDETGAEKALPEPEMEKLMLAYTPVTDDDLRLLAGRRSAHVKDAILKDGQVEPGRVFVIEPKSLAPEKKEKRSDSRVDFRLK
jgi:hypothetical protein